MRARASASCESPPRCVGRRPRSSRVSARLIIAREIRDATTAQSRMRTIDADIGPPMPAAVALGVRTRRYGDRERRAAPKKRGRRDEHEPKIVAERRKRGVLVARSHDVDLGLKRRADAASLTHRLELLLHERAHGENPLPF